MKMRIISKLWSSVYDLLLYIGGSRKKSLAQIHADLDVIEMLCRPYADADDVELEDLGEEVKEHEPIGDLCRKWRDRIRDFDARPDFAREMESLDVDSKEPGEGD